MSVNSKMTAIASAIRAKTDGSSKLTLDQMAAEIAELSKPAGTINITTNGIYDVTDSANAEVNVTSSEVDIQHFLETMFDKWTAGKGFSTQTFTAVSNNINVDILHGLDHAPTIILMCPHEYATPFTLDGAYFVGLCTDPTDQYSSTNNTFPLTSVSVMGEGSAFTAMVAEIGEPDTSRYCLTFSQQSTIVTFIVASDTTKFTIRNGTDARRKLQNGTTYKVYYK